MELKPGIEGQEEQTEILKEAWQELVDEFAENNIVDALEKFSAENEQRALLLGFVYGKNKVFKKNVDPLLKSNKELITVIESMNKQMLILAIFGMLAPICIILYSIFRS